jgi:hypothetical protein
MPLVGSFWIFFFVFLLSSYCSAFAYRPISYIPPWPKKNHYLELPPFSSPFLSHYNHASQDSVDRVSVGPDLESPDCKEFEKDSQDVYSCLESQCSQTFLGEHCSLRASSVAVLC